MAARVYGAGIARRNRRFDAGIGVERLPIPVISVGNLSVGGTGKTPMVMSILTSLGGLGHHACVAMRGYRAGSGESDEAAEIGRQFPDVPIVAQPDRIAGVRTLLASDRGRTVDAAVLDDGFQHRRIARDLDIVLLDATRDPFADRLLPSGWLREPVGSLGRAHFAVITHAEAAPPDRQAEIAARAVAINPNLKLAVASHRWAELRTSDPRPDAETSQDSRWGSPGELAGRRVLVACAIGNPHPFVFAAESHIGGPVAGTFLRRDHDPYTPPTIGALMDAARETDSEFILTTEKDWSKLRHVPLDQWPCPVLRPRLVLRIDSGREDLDRALAAVARPTAPDANPRPV